MANDGVWASFVGPGVGAVVALMGVWWKAQLDEKAKDKDRLHAQADKQRDQQRTQENKIRDERKPLYTELLKMLQKMSIRLIDINDRIGRSDPIEIYKDIEDHRPNLAKEAQSLRDYMDTHRFTISKEMMAILEEFWRVYDSTVIKNGGLSHKGGGFPEFYPLSVLHPAILKVMKSADQQARVEMGAASVSLSAQR